MKNQKKHSTRLASLALASLGLLTVSTVHAAPYDQKDRTLSKGAPRPSKNPFADSKWNASRDERGPRAVEVRFRDGLRMRLARGRPYDLSGKGLTDDVARAVLGKLDAGRWQRSMPFPADTMEKLQQKVSRRAGRRAPDLNLYFTYGLPKGLTVSDAVELLAQLPDVQFVYPLPQYEVAAVEDYRSFRPNDLPYQRYLEPVALGGMDVRAAWQAPGGDGASVDFFDVEFGFEPGHFELEGAVTDHEGVDAATAFPGVEQSRIDHGTASMGVAVGDARGPGITGIAPAAGKHFIAVEGGIDWTLYALTAEYCSQFEHAPGDCQNLPAVTLYPLVVGELSRGDVMLLEVQMAGPSSGGGITPQNQFGAVPVEYSPSNFDAIRLLTMAGVVVVEAAGNGEQDLDDPIYSVSEHRPFVVKNGVRVNDSGAILVGAVSSGAPWSIFLPGAGSPLAPGGIVRDFSNHGRRVDVHGWGDGVVTSGYGDLYGSNEPVLAYTMGYGGTSSASALIAGAVTALQGAFRADFLAHHSQDGFDGHLWGPTMRGLVQRTGVDATRFEDIDDPIVQNGLLLSNDFNLDPDANVGQRPDLRRAVDAVQTDPLSWGDALPPPVSSAPSGVLEREGSMAPIALRFGEGAPLHRGVVDILYTTDGSEPDCSPRCGGCDVDRVKIITQVSRWRWEEPIWLDLANGPVMVRARTHISDCGAPYGQELSATFE